VETNQHIFETKQNQMLINHFWVVTWIWKCIFSSIFGRHTCPLPDNVNDRKTRVHLSTDFIMVFSYYVDYYNGGERFIRWRTPKRKTQLDHSRGWDWGCAMQMRTFFFFFSPISVLHTMRAPLFWPAWHLLLFDLIMSQSSSNLNCRNTTFPD